MANFPKSNEIEIPDFTDEELKSMLMNSDKEELMFALGYQKKIIMEKSSYTPKNNFSYKVNKNIKNYMEYGNLSKTHNEGLAA